jgi:ubiquinone/menaquinone biosynthesis C-methylase UbiE
MRILDLGCGTGTNLTPWGVSSSDEITGVDIDASRVAIARARFPKHTYLQGAGEHLPFRDGTFDRVVASVAVPYMDIPRALTQMYRTLALGGSISLSLHHPTFTVSELVHHALPKPVPTVFRLYVLANGVFFHCTGHTLKLPNGRTESFQTRRGMEMALRRAGFVDISFRRVRLATGEGFFVDARKPGPASVSSSLEGLGTARQQHGQESFVS